MRPVQREICATRTVLGKITRLSDDFSVNNIPVETFDAVLSQIAHVEITQFIQGIQNRIDIRIDIDTHIPAGKRIGRQNRSYIYSATPRLYWR